MLDKASSRTQMNNILELDQRFFCEMKVRRGTVGRVDMIYPYVFNLGMD